MTRLPDAVGQSESADKIKCVIWDLDNTLWRGTLAEGDWVQVAPEVADIVRALDARGILQSIASKNDEDLAMQALRDWELADYFLYPQINWGAKSASIGRVARLLNIGIDSIAFIDDEAFELAEVRSELGDVYCLHTSSVGELLRMPRFMPRFITDESSTRRIMYQRDARRSAMEESFVGPKEEFLAALEMVFTIEPAVESDLQRLEELVARTHQLNTTGYAYSYEELDAFSNSPRHDLLVATLEDKLGSYGKIGLAVVEKAPGCWTIKLLLMSCRVMSRGVGSILINYITNEARRSGVRLLAEFRRNERNRLMYATYKLGGFVEHAVNGEHVLFESPPHQVAGYPSYVDVRAAMNLSGVPSAETQASAEVTR